MRTAKRELVPGQSRSYIRLAVVNVSSGTSQARSRTRVDDLWPEAERVIFASLYRAECHVTAARFFSNLHVFVGMIASGLAVAAGGSAFIAREWITGLLAILAAAGTGLLTSLRPDERSQLHWKAATAFWALADDVYMTFSFGAVQPRRGADADEALPKPPEPAGTGSAQTADRKTDPFTDAPGSLGTLRGFQTDQHRLEAVGPTVPVRLVRKAERWIAGNEEWFPPQYGKFQAWREAKETLRPERGLIRNLWRVVSKFW